MNTVAVDKQPHVSFLWGHLNQSSVDILNSYIRLGFEVDKVRMGGAMVVYMKETELDKEPANE